MKQSQNLSDSNSIKTDWVEYPLSETNHILSKFRKLVEQAPDFQSKGEVFRVGQIKQNWLSALENAGIALKNTDIVVRDADIIHTFRDAKHRKIPREWYIDLPIHLHARNPEMVILDLTHKNKSALLLIYKSENTSIKLVMKMNYNVRNKGVMNIIETGKPINLLQSGIKAKISARYILIEECP